MSPLYETSSGHLLVQQSTLLNVIDSLPARIFHPTVTDYNEAHRTVSRGSSPRPGPFRRTTAPHMVEIAERGHPDDPCHKISILKSVQSAGTFTIETVMAYVIEHQLGSMGFYTASKELAERRSKANIDRMIDDTRGLKQKVKPLSTRNSRKTGDSTFMKEFIGGIKLTIDTYNSIAGMKSNTMDYMFLDELDEAPAELKGQGDILSILEGRTMAVRKFKMFALSTPSPMDTSLIWRLFLEGDQRFYFVPCPICGEMQILIMMENKDHGLTYLCEKDTNIIIPETVNYVCEFCKKKFGESKKQKIMLAGKWRPTVKPQNPKHHSYHVSGLMSPEGCLSWDRICVAHAGTNKGKNILKYTDFTINIKGWPWSIAGKAPKYKNFTKNNLQDYTLGEVPPRCYILLGGADVQKDRIECLIMGIGPNFHRFLIDYKVFHGPTEDLNDLVWESFADFIENKRYDILGNPARVSLCAVDAGYDPKEKRYKDWNDKSHTVYNFVGWRGDRFIATRGSGTLKTFDVVKETRTSNQLCPKVYMLNTYLLKDTFMREINNKDGMCVVNFPKWQIRDGIRRPIDDELIHQLLSERKKEVKPGIMKWDKVRSRNEVFDTWIYATAMAYYQNIDSWSPKLWNAYYNTICKK